MSQHIERKESKLSQLYQYRKKLQDKLHILEADDKVLQEKLNKVRGQLTVAEKEITRYTERTVILITTHCIERYRERIGPKNATEDQVRKHLLTPEVLRIQATLGNCKLQVPDTDIEVVFTDFKAVSCMRKNVEYRKTAKRSRKKHIKINSNEAE